MKHSETTRIRRGFLPILTGCDLSRRRIPRLELEAEPGPGIWLTACAHGDEVGGIVSVHDLFRRLAKDGLKKGSIHAYPLMNPIGFDVCSRHITLSEEDLNRSFPGNPAGSLAERMAHTIFQSILKTGPSLVLDLHNDWTRTIPYILLDANTKSSHLAQSGIREQLLRFAAWANFPIVDDPTPLRRSLSHTLIEKGIPALTIELGESRVVNESNVSLGVAAIWRILAGLEMVDAEFPEIPLHETRVLTYSSLPLCSTSGILRFECRPGQSVRKGQALARVHDAFGRVLETLRAGEDALVLGIADSSATFPGAHAVAMGLF